jgi:acetyl-CoA carboxylase biotin carboxylase subunit
MTIGRVLVANRGEIALRIIRTLRDMGLESVAVYSDVDASAPHVLAADQARPLGEANPVEPYLNVERVLAAAVESGCQAVHPGYGFLSENAAFADACADAGLAFVGPPAEAIRIMGDKLASRRAMEAAGVPVVPGGPGEAGAGKDRAALLAFAEQAGLPLLVKASAGGGGKGMRVVRDMQELGAALDLCASEAQQAFGDDTLYMERYLEHPRHIEFQVFGDAQGQVFHLFERECSVQRRHQKIIEEAPSVALNQEQRREMGEAAVAAATAVGYRGAGTVEFLLDASGSFYFLEMNTRLQVEHPVTEEVLGVDLVQAQMRTAAGQPLDFQPEDLSLRGHALECRFYAEDPAAGFLPQAGRLLLVRLPEGPGVRVDGMLREGDEVSHRYDPLLAKIITYGADRDTALSRMERALEDTVVLGIPTNRDFLLAALRHAEFRSGKLSTQFVDEHLHDWSPASQLPDEVAAMAAVASEERTTTAAGATEEPGPWRRLGHWRLLSDG